MQSGFLVNVGNHIKAKPNLCRLYGKAYFLMLPLNSRMYSSEYVAHVDSPAFSNIKEPYSPLHGQYCPVVFSLHSIPQSPCWILRPII